MPKLIDLTGRKFDRLTVIKRTTNRGTDVSWLCSCICGNTCTVAGRDLKNGKIRSCGCLHREILVARNKRLAGRPSPTRTDLIGRRVGKLVVTKYMYTRKGEAFWECNCSCGNKVVVRGKHLREDKTRSCGCLCSESQTGNKNHQWNPNREEVYLAKVTRKLVHSLISHTLRETGKTKTTKSEKMLGYTKEQLRKVLESQFTQGMSWKNHGDWHIDHIKPVSAFVKEGVTDPKIINALDNLQPLWAKDNLRKGASY